ncbi:MAG: hypothetical protein ABSB41_18835 [Anaerolineales bacterium]
MKPMPIFLILLIVADWVLRAGLPAVAPALRGHAAACQDRAGQPAEAFNNQINQASLASVEGGGLGSLGQWLHGFLHTHLGP